jgi:hypothetical protein
VIDEVFQNRYRMFGAGCLLATVAAIPGVLSVMDAHRWEVVAVRAAYGIPFVWWTRPAATFWCTTILILVSEVTLAALGQSSGEWAFIPLMGASFVVGHRGKRERPLLGVVSFVVAVGVGVVANLVSAAPDYRIGLSPIVTVGLVGVSWLIGRETQRVRVQAEFAEGSRQSAAVYAKERERRAVVDERLRFAGTPSRLGPSGSARMSYFCSV